MLNQLAHQRRLLPHSISLLLLPIQTLLAELQIEIPKHPRKNHPHFSIGQVLANAVPWTYGKGLEDVAVIGKEWGRWVVFGFWEPAFGDEVVRGVEICW